MTSETVQTSLWLVPAEPCRSELRVHIDQLALEHGTPSFEPHITLSSGEVNIDLDVAAAIERIAGAVSPLDIAAGPTAHGPERFKAVFVEFTDQRLHDMAAELSDALGIAEADELRPHLSLIYAAEIPPETRARIAGAHTFRGRVVRFDTLAASVPGTGIDDVARWQTTVIRPLIGPPSRLR